MNAEKICYTDTSLKSGYKTRLEAMDLLQEKNVDLPHGTNFIIKNYLKIFFTHQTTCMKARVLHIKLSGKLPVFIIWTKRCIIIVIAQAVLQH